MPSGTKGEQVVHSLKLFLDLGAFMPIVIASTSPVSNVTALCLPKAQLLPRNGHVAFDISV